MLLLGSLATSFVCVRACVRAVSIGASGCFVKFKVVLEAMERRFQHGQRVHLTVKLFYLRSTIQSNVCISNRQKWLYRGGTSGKSHAAACSAGVVYAASVIPSPLAGGD